ncbi:hypothetical protein CLOP_g15773 [Closterium sp. NIES-67]|nr:hypothetical protein CLOP_g15773 [Closterium sp. NIES-67]
MSRWNTRPRVIFYPTGSGTRYPTRRVAFRVAGIDTRPGSICEPSKSVKRPPAASLLAPSCPSPLSPSPLVTPALVPSCPVPTARRRCSSSLAKYLPRRFRTSFATLSSSSTGTTLAVPAVSVASCSFSASHRGSLK